MKARPGARRSISRSAVMHSPRSRLWTVLSDITALKLLSGNGSLTALPRWSRPMTSGSQCIRAYSEMSSPKASSPGHALIKSLTRKPFAAADIEHAVTGLEIEVPHHVLGDRNPAAVVAVAAIAIFARSIEIELAVLARDRDDLVGLCLRARIDVALSARKLGEEIDLLAHVSCTLLGDVDKALG